MKKFLSILLLILPLHFTCHGQVSEQREKLFRDCLSTTGSDVKYLKDFRIQLGEANPGDDFRYKEKMSLWKNNRYRFILCTAENSRGKLIFNLRDEFNNEVLSSIDKNSGMIYPYVDFTCNKSGVYEFEFDFTGGQSGSGLSIISMIE
jgi:hypothetical protein